MGHAVDHRPYPAHIIRDLAAQDAREAKGQGSCGCGSGCHPERLAFLPLADLIVVAFRIVEQGADTKGPRGRTRRPTSRHPHWVGVLSAQHGGSGWGSQVEFLVQGGFDLFGDDSIRFAGAPFDVPCCGELQEIVEVCPWTNGWVRSKVGRARPGGGTPRVEGCSGAGPKALKISIGRRPSSQLIPFAETEAGRGGGACRERRHPQRVGDRASTRGA